MEFQPHHHGDGIYCKTGHAMEIGPKQIAGTTPGRPSACLLGGAAVRASLLLPLCSANAFQPLTYFLWPGKLPQRGTRLCCIPQ